MSFLEQLQEIANVVGGVDETLGGERFIPLVIYLFGDSGYTLLLEGLTEPVAEGDGVLFFILLPLPSLYEAA